MHVAFTAHYNGLRFYEELERRSLQRFTRVIATSSGFCLAIYGSAALVGYLVFGSSEQQHGSGAVQQRQEGEEQPEGEIDKEVNSQ